jgi:hypothetical protein
VRLVASKSHRSNDIDLFRRALEIEDEINVGSVGVKVGLVADASRDLYVYPGSRTKIWDSCGPEAVLLAAGGSITVTDGRALSYTAQEPQQPPRPGGLERAPAPARARHPGHHPRPPAVDGQVPAMVMRATRKLGHWTDERGRCRRPGRPPLPQIVEARRDGDLADRVGPLALLDPEAVRALRVVAGDAVEAKPMSSVT